MKRAFILVLVLSVAVPVAAHAPGQRMTIESTLSIKSPGAPQWSPDGTSLAFTVSEWNKKENRRDSHIHLATRDGERIIKLTNGERGETSPQWSPDGSRIGFLANRDSAPAAGGSSRGNQVWAISVAGGEAEKLTDEESGVSQFRWSPDGKRMAFVLRDAPKDKAEREKKKKEKFDAIVVDKEITYSHLWVLDLGTKEKKRLTEGEYSVNDPQWSPDGSRIAYVKSRTGSQESTFTDISEDRNTDIFLVGGSGGEAKQLTTNPGPDSQPRWSPDGRSIAYVASDDPLSWAGKANVLVMSSEGGSPRVLTAQVEDSLFGPQWSSDGSTVYVTGGVGVMTQLFRVSSGGGRIQPVFSQPASYGSFDLSRDGKGLAFTLDDSKSPPDVWTASNDGTGARRATNLNPEVRDFELAETRILKWKAADGLEIEGILILPLGYESGKRYPLILQIHGGPYGRFSYGFNARGQIMAANGYATLMPNPRGSTGYGNKFTTANVRDWGGKDYQDIMSGVDEVIRLGIADPQRLGVMGGSYGGFMTFWVVTQTDRFKAAIGHAGISDWYSFHGQSDIPGLMEYGFGGTPWTARETYVKYSPMTFVSRVNTPLMITHGERDLRVPIAQAEQYYRALRKRGVDVEFIRYPREGHGIAEPNHQIDLIGRQLEWFDRYVKNGAAESAGKGSR